MRLVHINGSPFRIFEGAQDREDLHKVLTKFSSKLEEQMAEDALVMTALSHEEKIKFDERVEKARRKFELSMSVWSAKSWWERRNSPKPRMPEFSTEVPLPGADAEDYCNGADDDSEPMLESQKSEATKRWEAGVKRQRFHHRVAGMLATFNSAYTNSECAPHFFAFNIPGEHFVKILKCIAEGETNESSKGP